MSGARLRKVHEASLQLNFTLRITLEDFKENLERGGNEIIIFVL